MIEIRWHGRGGQGAFTASKLFGESVALYGGKHALAFPSFGPERRGAPVLAFTKIDARKIEDRGEVKLCDYIVILDETLFNYFNFSGYCFHAFGHCCGSESYGAKRFMYWALQATTVRRTLVFRRFQALLIARIKSFISAMTMRHI